jgi:drug/metabolite transporter (DMT)-like permease
MYSQQGGLSLDDSRRRGVAYLMACAFLWSTAGVFIKLIMWHPLVIASLRGAIAVVVLWAVLCLRGSPRLIVNRRTLITGVFLGSTTLLFVTVNKLTTAATAIVLQSSNPIFILLFFALVRRQGISRRDLTVVLITLAGMALFFFDSLSFSGILGGILGILSAITIAGAFISASESASLHETMSGVLLGHLLGALCGLPFLVLYPPVFDPVSTGALVFLGVFQLGIPYVLFSLGARSCTPLTISLIGMLEPIFNPIWAAIFLREIPGLPALLGGIIVIGALIFRCVAAARDVRQNALPQ